MVTRDGSSAALLLMLAAGTLLASLVVSTVGPTLAADANGERILPLRELPRPMRGGLNVAPVKASIVGGVIWNDALVAFGSKGEYALWDIGGDYDLLEGHFGIDDESNRLSATLVFVGDGERLGSITVHRGDKARFFACPLKGCRALGIHLTQLVGSIWRENSALLANVRLVSGRDTPSAPSDLFIDDGETLYIEQPGEYTFHVR